MTTRPTRTAERLRLLKWFSIIVPAMAIYAAETVRHEWIEPMLPVGDMGNVIVGCIALGCTFVFSQIVFRIIDSTQSELVRRQAELEAVNTLTASSERMADPDRVATQAQSVLAALFPLDEIRIAMTAAAPGAAADGANDHLAPDRTTHVQPLGLEPAPDSEHTPVAGDTGEASNQMRIALVSHRSAMGEITVTRGVGAFDAAERRLLLLIGDTVNMTMRNATLQRELRSTAIAEERTWLAREMHDGIAQLLASMLVQIDMVEGRVREGNAERILHDLQRVRTTAERANADVRAEIAGLRLLTDGDAVLTDRVREYVEDFEDQTHILATFTTDGGAMPSALPDQRLQLVRILQEALANVRKHSQATVVDVRLHVDAEHVELIVEDNGQGIPWSLRDGLGREHHFGLATMQERAESQGGCLQVTPAVAFASGTRVRAWIPQQHGHGHGQAHEHRQVHVPAYGQGNGAHAYDSTASIVG